MSNKGTTVGSRPGNPVIYRDLAIDWRAGTQDARNDPAWRQAATDYHRARGRRTLVVETELERLAQLRRLMADDTSLERAWTKLNDPRNRPTPQVTIEAVWHCIRGRGVAALLEPANVARLDTFDDAARAELERRIMGLEKGA